MSEIKHTLDWYEENAVEFERLKDGSVCFHFDDGSNDMFTKEQYEEMVADQKPKPQEEFREGSD